MLTAPTNDEAGLILWERACASRIACEVRIIIDRLALTWSESGPAPKAEPFDWIDERMDRELCELVCDLERRGSYYLDKHFDNHTSCDRTTFLEHAAKIVEDARAHYGHDNKDFHHIEHAVHKAMGWTRSTFETITHAADKRAQT